MTKRELEVGRLLYPLEDYWRPATRCDCINVPRPCPFVACKWNLYLDVSPKTGAIKLNFPDLEPWEMHPRGSCAADLFERGGLTLEQAGHVMNMTRERIRQVEVVALAKIEEHRRTFEDFIDSGPTGRRRLPVLQGA